MIFVRDTYFNCSNDNLIILVVLSVLLLCIFALIVLQMRYNCLLPLVLHLAKLRIGLILANLHIVFSEVLIAARLLLVDIAGELLDLEVVEALVHQEVDSDHLVELVDTQSANRFEDPEEDHAEDARPGDYDH